MNKKNKKVAERKIIKHLAEQSLEKWMNNKEEVMGPCAFCNNALLRAYEYYKDAQDTRFGCSYCYVPKILCNMNNKKTLLFRMLFVKKRGIRRKRVYNFGLTIGKADKSGVYLMRTALQQLSKTGELTNELIKEIKEYIKSDRKGFLKNL